MVLQVKHIPKEIKKFIKGSTITKSIFRLQAYDSAMCRYFCIGFIDFINNLFSWNIFKEINETISKNINNGWSLWQLLMKKETVVNKNKVLESIKVKEVT